MSNRAISVSPDPARLLSSEEKGIRVQTRTEERACEDSGRSLYWVLVYQRIAPPPHSSALCHLLKVLL